eukprot:4380484-Prymnesium_polylepis.1
MSQTTPLGIGGPTSKQFCPFCLATLHETNVAGVVHLPACPAGRVDPRPPHVARPAPRAGTVAIDHQARLFAAATAAANAAAARGEK